MLEYYTVGGDYMDSLELTEELFAFLSPPIDLSPPFVRLTMEEAFRRWAGFDLFTSAKTPGLMESEARRLGIELTPGLSIQELFDLIFIHIVEPQIKLGKPVAILDYPAFVPCLAKKSPDGKTAERWELYARGIELANCFSEETNAEIVRRFFESEKIKKEKTALVRHTVDDDYWKIFSNKSFPEGKPCFPPCSGVAMGLDRLIMLLCGRSTIDAVLPFPPNTNLSHSS